MGLRPSRGRGQNFLTQPAIADRIVTAADLTSGDLAIEIGPGLGIISERLAATPIAGLTLIEIDGALAGALERRFAEDQRVQVIKADVLSIDLPALTKGRSVKIIGNLPFNSASAILRRLCEWRQIVTRMVLMFQREVGERIRARPGEGARGALSVFTELYWECLDHFRVRAGSFHPRPSVDAEVVVLVPRSTPALFFPSEEEQILDTVRAVFCAPRKMVRNALADGLQIGVDAASRLLEQAGIDPMARAATLETTALIALARAIRAHALYHSRPQNA
jgi:16S rRNA (adenine1518-N6/adenine1519-N6)-dimethyltransferase